MVQFFLPHSVEIPVYGGLEWLLVDEPGFNSQGWPRSHPRVL